MTHTLDFSDCFFVIEIKIYFLKIFGKSIAWLMLCTFFSSHLEVYNVNLSYNW